MKNKRSYIYAGIIAIVMLMFVVFGTNFKKTKENENIKDTFSELGSSITNDKTFKDSKYPLLAEIKDKDFHIYGVNKNDDNYRGVIVKYGKNTKEYDITYMTPMFILPKLKAMEFNKKEIIFSSFNVASGSEIYLEDLYGFYLNSNGNLEKIYFSPQDYKSQLDKAIKYNLKNNGMLNVTIGGGNNFNINLKDLADPNWKLNKITYGNNVSFIFDDGIKIKLGLEAFFENIVTPQYIGTVEAKVTLNKDNLFILKDIAITEN